MMDTVKLKEALSCARCQKVFQGRVFLCHNGHSTCGICVAANNKCMSCNGKCEIRNIAVEEIILNSKYNCEDCQRTFKLNDFFTHRQVCMWNCVVCADFETRPELMIRHLEDIHHVTFTKSTCSIAFEIDDKSNKNVLGFSHKEAKVLFYLFLEKKTIRKLVVVNLSLKKEFTLTGQFDGTVVNNTLSPGIYRVYKAYRYKSVISKCKFEILNIN